MARLRHGHRALSPGGQSGTQLTGEGAIGAIDRGQNMFLADQDGMLDQVP